MSEDPQAFLKYLCRLETSASRSSESVPRQLDAGGAARANKSLSGVFDTLGRLHRRPGTKIAKTTPCQSRMGTCCSSRAALRPGPREEQCPSYGPKVGREPENSESVRPTPLWCEFRTQVDIA